MAYAIREYYRMLILGFKSLTYNTYTSNLNGCFDTAMQPIFWVVDHVILYLGPVFVVLVTCATVSVVVIFYLYILPYIFSCSIYFIIFNLIFGHYLLINISFHYYQGVRTPPGRPPMGYLSIPVTTICKKCIGPKFPRTHHCSICNKCTLKMDHHCPWLNNCIGHFNHRYFLQYCVFMWIGVVYVCASVWHQFSEEFFQNISSSLLTLLGGGLSPSIITKVEEGKQLPEYLSNVSFLTSWQTYHNCIIYEFFLCSAVVFALGSLTAYHMWIITKGETSIEKYINNSERERLKKRGIIYQNPYDFGPIRNWQIFLGLENGRTFWKHVLFPSTHLPLGNGFQWEKATEKQYYNKKK